mgnify:CR=1 FL=1
MVSGGLFEVVYAGQVEDLNWNTAGLKHRGDLEDAECHEHSLIGEEHRRWNDKAHAVHGGLLGGKWLVVLVRTVLPKGVRAEYSMSYFGVLRSFFLIRVATNLFVFVNTGVYTMLVYPVL